MADTATTDSKNSRVDPYRAYNFKLDLGGVVEGHFTACDGLNIKVDAIKYRPGGAQHVVHRLAGRIDYGDITLRYGLTSSTVLWDWFNKSMFGNPERRNISIVLLDSDGITEVLRWSLLEAWPSEWKGASLDSTGREIAIESLTIVFESMERS